MSPDSRFLLERQLFGELPEGARVWREGNCYLITRFDYMLGQEAHEQARFWVDASRPEVREDGEPDRLDALPWLLELLGRRVRLRSPLLRLGSVHDGHIVSLYGVGGYPILKLHRHDMGFDTLGVAGVHVRSWPSSEGLDGEAWSRAIFVAALRQVLSEDAPDLNVLARQVAPE